MVGHFRWIVRSLQQDLRLQLLEAPQGQRASVLIKHLLKYGLAFFLYGLGLTGPLLRRTLRSSHTCLILGFHGVTDEPPGDFSRGHAVANLRDQLRYLRSHLRPVSLMEIAAAISSGEAPPPASFAVTFDDGCTNNVSLAIPLLKELQIPATFFVPSALVGSSQDLWVSSLREMVHRWPAAVIPEAPGLWPALPANDEAQRYDAYFRIKEILKTRDRLRPGALERLAQQAGGLPRPPEADRVVDIDRLRLMTQPGMTVGAHTRTHPILSSLEPQEARQEIGGSRTDLEQMLERPVLDFAYPNGRFRDVNDTAFRVVAETGFRCAVTTEPGTVHRGDDRLALRRCLPGNVPAFLAAFSLLSRARADRARPGDLSRSLDRRVSYLTTGRAEYAT